MQNMCTMQMFKSYSKSSPTISAIQFASRDSTMLILQNRTKNDQPKLLYMRYMPFTTRNVHL